jgi:hypothetical protein
MLPAPTARVRFREMTSTDLDDVDAVLQRSRTDAELWIAWNKRNYADHGHGLWVVETHDGQFVGDCGLTVQDIEGEPFVEVGYHVGLALRGQGFATEAALSVREAAGQAACRTSSRSSVPTTTRHSGWRRRSGCAWSGACSRTAGTPWCTAPRCEDAAG